MSRTTASIDVRAATGGAETRITESREPIRGLAWTNEGGVLYPRGNQLVVRGSDGRERIVLESDVNSPPANPEVCPGSGQIVFNWLFKNGSTAQNLWRINADGSEPYQLTDFPHTQGARCSPDGQWVVFNATTGVHRVRTNGGAVEMLHPRIGNSGLEWSPDSKTVTFISSPATGERTRRLIIITPGLPLERSGCPLNLLATRGSPRRVHRRLSGTQGWRDQHPVPATRRFHPAPDGVGGHQFRWPSVTGWIEDRRDPPTCRFGRRTVT